MPYKDPQQRKEYYKRYYIEHKMAENPHMTEQDVIDMIEGMSAKEMFEFGESIRQAQEELDNELPERYQRLRGDALSRIKAGESSIMFDVESEKTETYDSELRLLPKAKLDEDEIFSWGQPRQT